MYSGNSFSNPLFVLGDLGLYQGDYKTLDIHLENENGVPVIEEGISIEFIICDIDNEDMVFFTKMANKPDMTNIYKLIIESNDTNNIPIGKYRYIINVIYESGDKNVSKGYLTIL